MAYNYLPSNHLVHHRVFRDHNVIPTKDSKYKYIKKIELTQRQIDFYRDNGYLVIEDALNDIDEWTMNFNRAVGNRTSNQIFPDNDSPWGEDSIKQKDTDYNRRIFTQRIYLSQLDKGIRPLVKSAGCVLGELASKIADIDCIRLWHEEALIKPPISNQLLFHYDGPAWSFQNDKTLTAWIALGTKSNINTSIRHI